MKLLGANDDMNGSRGPSVNRSQDDAAVGYVFQRHPHEADFPHFSHKQTPQPPRWASGDETIIDVSMLCAFNSINSYFFSLQPLSDQNGILSARQVHCASSDAEVKLNYTKNTCYLHEIAGNVSAISCSSFKLRISDTVAVEILINFKFCKQSFCSCHILPTEHLSSFCAS